MLVFKSATDKLVIGRIENDEVIPLDEKALELCEEHGFSYDESLVETEEAEAEAEADEEKPVEKPAKGKAVKAASEEDEKPAKGKAVKAEAAKPKKSSASEAEEAPAAEKKAVKSAPSKKTATPASNDGLKDFEAILQRHTKELQEFVAGRPVDSDKVSELEQQVVSLKKELDESKKKMKSLLAAMQGDL
jgi:hypothetical protein